MPNSRTCPECGAVVPEGVERCSLCGASVPGAEESGADEPRAEESGADAAAEDAPEAPAQTPAPVGSSSAGGAEGVFCNQCGWQNPPGANFCSRCGHELEDVETGDTSAAGAAPPAGTKPAAGPPAADAGGAGREEEEAALPSATDDGMTRRVALVVGVAVLLVGGLFVWSVWSGSQESSASASSEEPASTMSGGAAGVTGGMSGSSPRSGGVPGIIRQQQEGDVPASIAPRADSLQGVIDARSGPAQQAARRELARLFAGEGLTGRAAAQQWQLARSADSTGTGATAAWERAGSLLYDWMASLERGQERAQVARLTVDAYQRVLQAEPDNHDVRTNLAVAYLDTNNPMRGISEIKRVLEENPDHIGARFNYGLMQVMIGRNATALTQFERVRATASEDSPYYQQAGQIIQRINEQSGGDPQDAPTPSEAGAPGAGASGS